MVEAFGPLSRMAGDAAGALAWIVAGGPLLPAIMVVGLTFALATLAAISVAARAITARSSRTSAADPRSPRMNADLRVLISQSNPDAPGHVRSRAPGSGHLFS